MSFLGRKPVKPSDRQLSSGQINEIQRLHRGTRLGQPIISDEIQYKSVGTSSDTPLELSSIPVLYLTVESEVTNDSSSSTQERGGMTNAKRVKRDGEAVGAVLRFATLESQ